MYIHQFTEGLIKFTWKGFVAFLVDLKFAQKQNIHNFLCTLG